MPTVRVVIERVDATETRGGRRFVVSTSVPNGVGGGCYTTFNQWVAAACHVLTQRYVELDWRPVEWNTDRWRTFHRRTGQEVVGVREIVS